MRIWAGCVILAATAVLMVAASPAYEASDEKALEVLRAAVAKTEGLEDKELFYDFKRDLIVDGQALLSQRKEIHLKAAHLGSPDEMLLYADGRALRGTGPAAAMTMENAEMAADTEIAYYGAGMRLWQVDELKFREPATPEEGLEYITPSMLISEETIGDLEHVAMRTEGEKRIISFTRKKKDLRDFEVGLGGLLMLGEEVFAGTEISAEYTIDEDGYFTNAQIVAEGAEWIEGTLTTLRIVLDIRSAAPGAPVTIDLPDPDGYTDIH